MNRFAMRLVPALALALTSAGAWAQDCSVDEAKPGDLGKASLAIKLAGGASPDMRAKQLRGAMQILVDKGDKIAKENQLGQQLVLGEAYTAWLLLPNQPQVVKRGDLGISANKDQTVDLLAAADSAFRTVEKGAPECVAYISRFRRHQVWADLVNAGFAQLNAGNLDSSEKLILRSQLADPTNPYAFSALANIAQARSNTAAAMDLFRKAIAASASDTIYSKVRLQALYQLGQSLEQTSSSQTGAAKTAMQKEAVDAYRRFVTEAPNDPDAAVVGSQLASLMLSMGDTASVPTIYADQLTHPGSYGDIALVTAGVIASQANHNKDAAQLFEAALAQNPYSRDALSNLGITFMGLGKYDSIPAVAQRLIAIDPSNPDNWLIYASAFQGMYQMAKTPAAKKLATDSLAHYNNIVESMPAKVQFTQFTRASDHSILAGTIENRSKAAKTYTITFEFLDKSGAVVGTQAATVAVDAGQTTPFKVQITKGGVVGFRYAPIT